MASARAHWKQITKPIAILHSNVEHPHMKTLRITITAGMLAVLLAGWANAQTYGTTEGLRQPASVQRTAPDHEGYVSFAEPSDKGGASDSPSNQSGSQPGGQPGDVPPAKSEPPAATASGDNGEDDADKPWTLPQPRFLSSRGITLGGWTEVGGTANNWNTDYNGPVSFADRADRFLLNQQWLFLDKPINNDGCGWAWGGHMDMIYGSDAIFTQADGLETPWDQSNYNQLALPQFYVDVAYNNLTLRVGHFFTILGYEVVQAPQNFFYTHAYTMQYGEPFTHTGMLLMYKVNDQLSVSAGLHRGDDQFGPSHSLTTGEEVDHLGALGGIKWVSSNKKLELAWAASASQKTEFEASQVISSFVSTYHVSDKFRYVFQSDFGQVANSYQVGGAHANWYGVNQYFLYQFNKCWGAGIRAEWFSDRDGVRVTGLRAENPIYGNFFPGDFYEISMGLNWKPTANFTLRPELRYDWYDPQAGVNFFPFDDGRRSHQWLLGMDAILTY
jgi:hypothetical protein